METQTLIFLVTCAKAAYKLRRIEGIPQHARSTATDRHYFHIPPEQAERFRQLVINNDIECWQVG